VSTIEVSPSNADWLAAFRQAHGRAPRVLHIGNIANNAYNNAKLLNGVGLDCDVICYDYYHLMGCPEWEDVDFDGHVADQFAPDWTRIDLGGYERPRWFAQGPLALCADYLGARREGDRPRMHDAWKALSVAARIARPEPTTVVSHRRSATMLARARGVAQRVRGRAESVATSFALERHLVDRLVNALDNRGLPARGWRRPIVGAAVAGLLPIAYAARAAGWVLNRRRRSGSDWVDRFELRMKSAIANFERAFPGRADQLRPDDMVPYTYAIPIWERLLRHYDLVQAYATDPIIPMLASKRPYIGFEHGTLRVFTLGDSPVCRLTALAYNQADHVFVTNGDCLDYAHRIGVERLSPMLHPFDERMIRSIAGDYEGLHRRLGVKHVFLCTLRHDWAIKGTDIYIRALPALRDLLGDDFRLLMTTWGSQVAESRALASSLGAAHLVDWIAPMPRRRLVALQKSVDVLFDQIALPHFGATAPEGIAAGVPVVMSYDPASTAWIVDEPAPILTAWTPEDVVRCVQTALDPAWRARYRAEAERWIERHHNAGIVVNRHLDAYRTTLPVPASQPDPRP